MERRDYGTKMSRRRKLRFCFGAEDGQTDAADEKKDGNRDRDVHFLFFSDVGLNRADFGHFFCLVVGEARMN